MGSHRPFLRAALAALALVPGVAAAGEAGLRVEIRPEKPVWSPRATIRGTVLVTNVGAAPVAFDPQLLDRLDVTDERGSTAEVYPGEPYCAGTITHSEIVVVPGETFERPFFLETDPLLGWAWVMVEGEQYALTYVDPRPYLGVAVERIPASIEIRRARGERTEPRVLEFAAGPNRILVIREGGLIESHDATTGQRLHSVTLPEVADVAGWWRRIEFAPDARHFALVRAIPRENARADHQVLIYDLAAARLPPVVTDLPADGTMCDRFWVVAFDGPSEHVLVRGRDLLEVSVADGRIAKRGPPREISPRDRIHDREAGRVTATSRTDGGPVTVVSAAVVTYGFVWHYGDTFEVLDPATGVPMRSVRLRSSQKTAPPFVAGD